MRRSDERAYHDVSFVSYDGEWPALCHGNLVLDCDGERYAFPSGSLNSGGRVWFEDDWTDHVEKGPWSIDWEYLEMLGFEFPEDARADAERVVNENIEHGCCGGCV